MNLIHNIQFEARLALLFLFGIVLGGQLNRGIYGLALINPRPISPWLSTNDGAGRRWTDYVPVIGWWGLRREVTVQGPGFWIRPLMVELAMGIGLGALYWWEIQASLYPESQRSDLASATLHLQFLSHCILISMMVMATFIDIDEKTIPDSITVPGTLCGLTVAALFPSSLLPNWTKFESPPLWLTSTHEWPIWLNTAAGLMCGLACFVVWCYAIIPKVWWTRSGWKKAFVYLLASIPRYRQSWWIFCLAGAGGTAITGVWFCGGQSWQGLFTALVGLAFGGGLVWAVRIMGSAALGQEAMGFGDVTLMAMVGTFVGWQSTLVIFFLAPFAGLLLAVSQWIVTGRRDIPYGPFLCVATLTIVIFWLPIWTYCQELFQVLGILIPGLTVICLILMTGMLLVWRSIAEKFE